MPSEECVLHIIVCRTRAQMVSDGRWGSELEVQQICDDKLAAGLWRPHPDAPRSIPLRRAHKPVMSKLCAPRWSLHVCVALLA